MTSGAMYSSVPTKELVRKFAMQERVSIVKGMLAAVGLEVMPEGMWRELEDEEETLDMIIAGAVQLREGVSWLFHVRGLRCSGLTATRSGLLGEIKVRKHDVAGLMKQNVCDARMSAQVICAIPLNSRNVLSGFKSRYIKPIKCRYSNAAVTSAA